MTEYEKSIELNPVFFAALKNLAVLYQQKGFRHKAIELWERAMGAAPEEETRKLIRENLLKLL